MLFRSGHGNGTGPGAVPLTVTITTERMPTLYLGHGAPMLLDDEVWVTELGAWARTLPRPERILIVSAHWQSAPLAISSTHRVPLVYDFFGFPREYYELTYDAPPAPDLAADVRALMPDSEPILEREERGLDHGAWEIGRAHV